MSSMTRSHDVNPNLARTPVSLIPRVRGPMQNAVSKSLEVGCISLTPGATVVHAADPRCAWGRKRGMWAGPCMCH